jgi:ferredoxin
MEIEIDGKVAQVPDGSTIMDAAQQLGAYIPHFCYHKKLSIAANCRMCLVQVEKAPKPLPACATPVTNGMKVFTHSELAIKAQKGVMEFLLINHPLDCPICDQGGRVSTAGSGRGLWWQCLTLSGRQAGCLSQGCGFADLDAGDGAVHPLHALRPLRTGDRWRHGTGHGQPATCTPRS